jgi:hypothetical protein
VAPETARHPPVAIFQARRKTKKKAALPGDVPRPEERPLGRVSKDGSTLESWFETRKDALLNMRSLY